MGRLPGFSASLNKIMLTAILHIFFTGYAMLLRTITFHVGANKKVENCIPL
ncbi:hypothetical protein SCFA_2540004 [anaerobic digester metagenome]|uniref:Uncharacterized protein n=1 Tax=anaerobic digester metagenome TaxID=1263854 RepID=A0A485M1I1_9ZZZZ